MTVDKEYCMSSFLMFRTVHDRSKIFADGLNPTYFEPNKDRIPVMNSHELEKALKTQVEAATADGKAALALSGGIDSAILARFMPKGSVAYTFRCVVPGVCVTDETEGAKKYAEECGLEHRVVEIYWEDIEKFLPLIMKRKGAPVHSIEVQIYKAALRAKADGFERLIFGESADCLYGGLSNVLSRDWTYGDFIERYSFVMPYKVLKNPVLVTEPYLRHMKDGYVDVHEFYEEEFFRESVASYLNASECAGIDLVLPYAQTKMAVPLNYDRVRSGENKYLVREVFSRFYDGFPIPPKTPMPRPTAEWLKNWQGPERKEFWSHCTDGMSGDQKWLVYCLERFLNMIDGEENDSSEEI